MENKTFTTPEAQQEAREQARAQRNKKIFIFSSIAILVILVVAGAVYFLHANAVNKANDAIGLADIETNDSIRAAMYQKIADDGSTAANERAQLMVAIRAYNDSNYTKAIEYLDKTSVSSEIIGAGVYSIKGDCYANLNKLDEAISEYENAVSKADGNPTITPFVLIKMANIYAQQQNYAKEYECYSTIRTDYQAYVQQAGINIDKYVERARIRAGK